jgi:hypothetical protein
MIHIPELETQKWREAKPLTAEHFGWWFMILLIFNLLFIEFHGLNLLIHLGSVALLFSFFPATRRLIFFVLLLIYLFFFVGNLL